VPVEIAVASARVVELCDAAHDETRASAIGDLAVAALLGAAAMEGAAVTTRINLAEHPEPALAKTLDDARAGAQRAQARLAGRPRA
jgi:formiminotetrahydrofolate cyclodeaminase